MGGPREGATADVERVVEGFCLFPFLSLSLSLFLSFSSESWKISSLPGDGSRVRCLALISRGGPDLLRVTGSQFWQPKWPLFSIFRRWHGHTHYTQHTTEEVILFSFPRAATDWSVWTIRCGKTRYWTVGEGGWVWVGRGIADTQSRERHIYHPVAPPALVTPPLLVVVRLPSVIRLVGVAHPFRLFSSYANLFFLWTRNPT